MSAWVKLCIHVLEAEYSSCELVQCFAVLNLEHNSQGSGRWENNIQTLARAFGVDPVSLRRQVVDLGTIAQQYYRAAKQSFLNCWIHTVHKVEIRGSTSIVHATDAVRGLVPLCCVQTLHLQS